MGSRYTAVFLVHEGVLAYLAIPASGIFPIELKDQVDGGVLQFPTSRAEWRLVILLVIERFVERHLFPQFERLLEVFVLRVELSILLDQIHNARVQIKNTPIQFDVLNLVDCIGDFFCVVEDSHGSFRDGAPSMHESISDYLVNRPKK